MVKAKTLEFYEVTDIQTTTRVFAAYRGILPLGALSLDEKANAVEIVFVQTDFREQGIASRLLTVVREATGLSVANATNPISPSGERFAARHGLHIEEPIQRVSEREGIAFGSRLMVGLWGGTRIAVDTEGAV